MLKRLAEIPESDFAALNTAIQQGYDHEGDAGPESLLMTQTAPHARPDLTRCVVAPNGDYACFAGLWYNDVLKCGYLEPLCTRPAYRGMGLARSVLYTQMREIRAMGALYLHRRRFLSRSICRQDISPITPMHISAKNIDKKRRSPFAPALWFYARSFKVTTAGRGATRLRQARPGRK